MNDSILDFLGDVDERIYERGADYYESGKIASLVGDGAQFTAKVEGSGCTPYTVKIGLTEEGEVGDFSCDCPYDGTVCKHIVAVLLAIDDGEYDKKKLENKRKPAGRSVSLEALVEDVPKRALAELVLDYATEDEAFCAAALFALGASAKDEFSAAKEYIKASIRRNSRRGYIDYSGCDSICRDMESVLDKAQRRLEYAQPGAALTLARHILMSGVKLASEADSSSGALGYVIDCAFQLIERSVTALSSCTKAEKNKALGALLQDARGKAFDGWEQWRYELLSVAAGLADKASAAKLYDLLDEMKKEHGESDGRPYFSEYDRLARYRVLFAVEGKTAARSYLNENLEVDELRRIAVEEDIASGSFESAERLCREKAFMESRSSYAGVDWWDEMLYKIYCRMGRRDKQLTQAKRLLLMGGLGYWQTVRELLAADGKWEDEYHPLLAKLKTSRPYHEYMGILSDEGELALLMAEVRVHPETAFRYGKQLCGGYATEVNSLCVGVIQNEAKQAADRSAYKRVCGRIRKLAEFGATSEAEALIRGLRETYPRRPAMLDELERLERRLGKEKKRGSLPK